MKRAAFLRLFLLSVGDLVWLGLKDVVCIFLE